MNYRFPNRKLGAQYSGYKSVGLIATSGVPQGSALSPILFTIFTNDISLEIQCPSLLYRVFQ